MKVPHITLAGLTGVVILLKELYEPIQGTGQSVMDLWHAGWTYQMIRQYFPIPPENVIILGVAIGWLVYGGERKLRRRRKRENA